MIKRIRYTGYQGFIFLASLGTLIFVILSCGCMSSEQHIIVPPKIPDDISTVSITDSLNQTVTLSRPVKRLVVNHADGIEMMLALDAGDLIIGVPDTALTDPDFTGRLKNARGIGDWNVPDPETILTLKPDAIIVLTSKTRNIDLLASHNMTVLYLDCFKLDTLPSEAEILGKITGKEERAKEYQMFVTKYQKLVFSRIPSHQDNPPVIYAEKYTDFQPEGSGSGVDQMIHRLGARNIASGISGNVKISPEWVVERNPDIILRFESNSYLNRGGSLKEKYDAIFNRTGFKKISAIEGDRVYILQSDMFYSPRAVVGLVYLAKILYPNEFADIDPDDVLAEYETKFLPVSYRSEISYPAL